MDRAGVFTGQFQRLRQMRAVAVDRPDLRALLGQTDRHGPAIAPARADTASARDHCHLVCKTHRACSLRPAVCEAKRRL